MGTGSLTWRIDLKNWSLIKRLKCSVLIATAIASGCSPTQETCDIERIISQNTEVTCYFKGYVSNIGDELDLELSIERPNGSIVRGQYLTVEGSAPFVYERPVVQQKILAHTSQNSFLQGCLSIRKVEGWVTVVDYKPRRCS